MCPLNTTFLHKFLDKITARSTKSLFLHKYLTRKKKSKYLLLVKFKPNVAKTAHTERKGTFTFNRR